MVWPGVYCAAGIIVLYCVAAVMVVCFETGVMVVYCVAGLTVVCCEASIMVCVVLKVLRLLPKSKLQF